MTKPEQLAAFENELAHGLTLNPYNQFTQLWHLVLRASMEEPQPDEFGRVRSLVSRLPLESVSRVLANAGVDELLDLDPPLETVLAHRHERLETVQVHESIAAIRARRLVAPREALVELGSLLKRIRNKLEHGFKTPSGPRDQEILGAACRVAESLVRESLALRRAEIGTDPSVSAGRAS